MEIILTYLDKKQEYYNGDIINIKDKNGEISIFENHCEISGIGTFLKFNNYKIEKNFFFIFEKNNLKVFFTY